MALLYIIDSHLAHFENVTSNTFEALLNTSTGFKAFYEILFFVVDKIGINDIIIGDPALRLHPGLLNSVLSTDIVTEYFYFKDAPA
ncbi:hypothetical protein ACO0SA_000758 [Hanseniaspora valbyensis]